MNEKEKPKTEAVDAENALMWAIGFTEDDLEANRGGYMSKKQRGFLSHERADWLKGISIIIGLASILFIVILLKGIAAGDTFPDRVTAIAFVCLAAALISLYMWFRRSLINADLRKGDVYVAEGLVSLHIIENQNKATVS